MNHIVKIFVEKSCDPITAQYYLKESKIREKISSCHCPFNGRKINSASLMYSRVHGYLQIYFSLYE
jgi:hypothetical protein